MLITSLKNERIKELVKLKDKKYRDNNKIFFVEGKDLIDAAYNSHLLKELFLLEGTICEYKNIPVTYVSMDVMKKISDMESASEYFGICNKKEDKDLGNRVIVLDNIQDPGNFGTIIRSAVAFGFDTIVISKSTVDLYNPKVVRSSKGMLFNINIIVRDLVAFLNKLDGYTIYGTDVTNGINIKDEVVSDKIVIIIGNEGNGISKEVRECTHKFIYIPMNNKCESLNAGVCASIIMYEVDNK